MDSIFSVIVKSAQQKALSPVDSRGGWFPWVREPYAGAWQRNDEWTIQSVLENPTVYACITLISTDIGKLPFLVMEKDSQGIWNERTHPQISPLLKKPNRFQNHIQFKTWWIMSKLIWGNTYVLKERDRSGTVIRLYILDPSRVQVLVTDFGDVYYQLNQDVLNGQVITSVTVPASEIIHDRMNCLFHPLIGVSPLFAGGLAASQGLKIENDSSTFFANGANPGGVLTAPGSISKDTADRLKLHWESNYTGENAGKVAVLGDGLHYEPMRMKSTDAQLIEQLRKTDEAICSVFHVPAYMVGVGPVPSQSNIEALTQDYYSKCLQILIESMELCLDDGLEVPERQGIELDLDVLFRMDTITLIRMLAEGVGGQIFATNEARKRVNLPPVEGGDDVLAQQQNYSLAALAKRDAKEDPFATSSANDAAATPPAVEDETEKALAYLFTKSLAA